MAPSVGSSRNEESPSRKKAEQKDSGIKKVSQLGDVEERLQGYNMRLGITQCLGSALVYADPDIALLFSTDSYPVFFNVDSDIESRYLQKYEQKNKL